MKLLITGFPPFPGRPDNPAQEIVRTVDRDGLGLSGVEVHTAMLPCEYQGVEDQFPQLVEDVQPDTVLSFGVGRQQSLLRLETRGINLDDAGIPDNAGELRTNRPIRPEAPQELYSPLDLVSLANRLRELELDVDVSFDAGRYVCNHLLYVALLHAQLSERPWRFLFTHVCTYEAGFDLPQAMRGLEAMAAWFRDEARRSHRRGAPS